VNSGRTILSQLWGNAGSGRTTADLYFAMKDAKPEEKPGIYQLTNADGKWEQAAKFDD
jgi:hypothetical protein